jgi:peptide/nickel transport system substrate-binding protein
MASPTDDQSLHNALPRRTFLRLASAGLVAAAAAPILSACGSSGSSSSPGTSAAPGTSGSSATTAAGATATTTGAAPTTTAAAGTPKKGGTLSFARSVEPTTLDPANTIIAGDIYTLDKIFEPLYITDATGKLQPWLASGHTVSSNQLTWTFTLRPGVKFSDGSPLTSADVAFSINRERKNTAGPLSFLDYAIKSITTPAKDTVVFHLSQPWAPFLSDISVFANAIIPANFGGKTEKAFFDAPIGTGPFLLASFAQGATLSLKANPSYWQTGKPYVDEVVITYVTDDNQRILQLKGSQVDIIDAVPPSEFASLKAASGVTATAYPAWEVDLLVMNEKLPQFKDVHVRRAIAQAINRETLTSATTFGTATPGGSFFPPSLEFYDPKTPVLAYDVSAAKAELAKSSYPHGFSTKLLVSAGDTKYAEICQIIQADLKVIGIDVSITSLDHASFETTFQKFDYEMFLDYAINDISDCDEMASFELNYKDGGSSSYWSSYNNPAVTKLVDEAETASTAAARTKLYSEIQAAVAADVPFVPLDYQPYLFATTSKVNGFAVNPGGAYRLEDVWLD